MRALKSPGSLVLPLRAEVLLVGLNPSISELAGSMEHVLGRDRDLSARDQCPAVLLSGTRTDRHDFHPAHLVSDYSSQQIPWS